MAARQIPELGTPEADCYFFDDYVSAEGPAVAHLYPNGDFLQTYANAEQRIFEEWTIEDFSTVALAREIERLRTGDDLEFRNLFDRARATLETRRTAEPETGRAASKRLKHLGGKLATIDMQGQIIVPPHQREKHEKAVGIATRNKRLRDLICLLHSGELVHQGDDWALFESESSGGPYARVLNPATAMIAARLMPEEWADLLDEADESKASDLEELVAPSTHDTKKRPASDQEAPPKREHRETNHEGKNVKNDTANKNSTGEGGPNVTTRMVRLAVNKAELFHDGKRGYAAIAVEDHRESFPVQSSAFRTWITTLIYASEGKIPSGTAIADARNVIEGLALAEGECIKPAIRTAGTLDEMFIDLGDTEWRCVRVTRDGWSIVAHPEDVFFIQPGDFGELPEPLQGANLELMRKFVNLSEDQLRLFQAFLLMACHPQGPYVQLVSCGVPGATKSSLQKVAKALIDPTKRPANSPAPVSLSRRPTKSGDLFVAGSNSHLVTADNLSHINDELSDELCCLATGDAWRTRKLYTNFDEASIDVCRPAMLNGISNPVRRSDHGERAILIETTKPRKVIDEDDYWRLFEEAWPLLLGALYDALAEVIRLRVTVMLPFTSRMVGFDRVGTAAAQALGWKVNFSVIYRQNQQQIMADITDGEPILARIVTFAQAQREWSGSPGDLLDAIKETRGLIDLTGDKRGLPDSGKAMAEVLKRNKEVLKQEGVTWDYLPSNSRKIRLLGEVPSVAHSEAAV